jgi:hypothetical protein
MRSISLLLITGTLLSRLLAQQAPPEGEIASYPFNGNADEQYSGRSSIVYGANLTQDRFGQPNSAYAFPGQSIAYINLGTGLLLQGSSDQTITWWERIPTDAGGGLTFLTGYASPNDTWTLAASVRADGPFYRVEFEAFAKLSGGTDWVTTSSEWTHRAVVFRGTTATEFFQDGVLIASAPGIPRNPGELFLGAKVYSYPNPAGGDPGGIFANPFKGDLDDIRLFDHALSPSEMAQVSGAGGPFMGQTIEFAPIPDVSFSTNTLTLSATASSGLAVSFRVVSGPGSITGNQFTITGTGSITVAADQPGNSKYEPASAALRTFSVNPGSQTLDFPSPGNVHFSSKTVSLSASASSGLPVSFALVSGPATLEGNVLTLTGIGVVSVTASQPGDGNYSAATPITQSFSVIRATQEITFEDLADRVYSPDPVPLVASSSSGLPVRFILLSGPAVKVGNTLSLRGTGNLFVEARQDGDNNYAEAAPVTRSFKVTMPPVGPTAFYPFNGNANEESTGRPSIVVGATLTADRFGNANSAYRFSTSSLSYINLGPGLLRDSGNDQTLAWWQKRRTGGVVLSGYASVASSWNLFSQSFSLNTNRHTISLGFSDPGHSAGDYRSPLVPTSTDWEHFALVLRGSSSAEIYRNGSRVPVDSSTGSPWRQAGDLYVGTGVYSFPDPNGGDAGGLFWSPFEGDLDDIRILDKPLSASEIRDLYLQETAIKPPSPPQPDPGLPVGLTTGLVAWYPLNGDAWDASGTGNHGVVLGALSAANRFGEDGKALRFPPGSDAVVMMPGQFLPSGQDPMTLSMWLRLENPETPPGAGFSQYPVLSGQGNGFNDWDFHLILQGNGIDISPVLAVMGPAGVFGEYGTWNLFNGVGDALNWHHIAIVVENSTNATLYLDGVKVAWGPAQNGFLRAPSEILYLGWAPRSQGLGGSLDEVRIYNRALSEEEVLQLNQHENSLR